MFPCQQSCSLILYWIWMPASESLLKWDQSHDKNQDLEAEARKTLGGIRANLFKSGPLTTQTALHGTGAFPACWRTAFPAGVQYQFGLCSGSSRCSPVTCGAQEVRADGPYNLSRSVRTLKNSQHFKIRSWGQQSGNDWQEEDPAGDNLLTMICLWHVSSRSYNNAATADHDSPGTPTSGGASSGERSPKLIPLELGGQSQMRWTIPSAFADGPSQVSLTLEVRQHLAMTVGPWWLISVLLKSKRESSPQAFLTHHLLISNNSNIIFSNSWPVF